jgi:DNA-binding FrmR family transcriptional regulator
MKNNEQLLNNIIGQLNGVKRMIGEGEDCTRVITQLKASKAAINTTMNRLIEERSRECLKGVTRKDREKIIALFKEVVKNN